jgi:uncharacterized protein
MTKSAAAWLMLLSTCCASCDSAQSEFITAANSGDIEKARRLLKNGATVEGRTNDDWTALTVAAREGRLEFVQYLLDQGASINASEGGGNTALFWAAYEGHLDLVKFLVERGADPTLKCDRCLTPAAIARKRGHDEVRSYLEQPAGGTRLR